MFEVNRDVEVNSVMNGDLPEKWQQKLLSWVFAAVNTLIERKKSDVLSIVEKALAIQENAFNKTPPL